jgi:hypothetical protein
MESWDLFDAAEVVAFGNMLKGATIIPLGELFTIKRTGKHKFRQIAMGNLMKEGRDYGETFSLPSPAMASSGFSSLQLCADMKLEDGTLRQVTCKWSNESLSTPIFRLIMDFPTCLSRRSLNSGRPSSRC